MKHVRDLEVDQPLDELIRKHTAEKAFLSGERQAGPNFFRGVIIALPISLSFWAAVFHLIF